VTTLMRVVLAALLAALVTACGVPQDDAPRTLDPGLAPFRIFEPDEVPDQSGEVEVELFFVKSDAQADRVVPVSRRIDLPGSSEQVVEQLFAGPTTSERNSGLSSAVPETFEVENVDVDGGIALVTLDGVSEQGRTDSVVAFAQIVATLTGRPDVDGVRFRTAEGDLSINRGDGSLTDAPVNRESYAQLLGLPVPTTAVPPPPVDPATEQPAAESPPAEG
jgi:spore germination protein GerM